jgi:hypothetical protein
MKFIATVPLLLCSGFATQLYAQSAQEGFYTNGYAELSYFNGSGTNGQTLGYSEATIGYNTPSGFGGEVGVDALITENDDESAIYGALTYQSSFGKLSFGVPRAAIDAYLGTVPTVAGAVPFKIGQIGNTKRSIITTSYLLTSNDEVPVGLRYDGTFGATNVGVSYHRYNDADVYDLAANYQIGETTLTGALEHFNASGSTETRYFLGAETKFGQVSAGVLWSGNYVFTDDAALEAYAKFKPLDQLELSATALNTDVGSGASTIYGLAADYTFSKGAYVQAGVADTFESSSDTAVNVALGLRF